MADWPHAPLHRLDREGTYMVTAGTYHKKHFFHSRERLQLLHDALIEIASDFGWNLQAWAVLSNHYHFVAVSPSGSESLRQFLSKLHMTTAKQINQLDQVAGRKVWFQYWDTRITYQRSYLTRLQYVHSNPVHHGVVRVATDYVWCSAQWFERTASESFRKVVSSFDTNRVTVMDDFSQDEEPRACFR